MTEFQREETAFREAFSRYAEDIELGTFRRPRETRRRWRAPLLVAAVVLLLVGVGVGIAGSRTDHADLAPAVDAELANAQWIGVRNIEVKAPIGWPALYERTHPDCIRGNTDDPAQPSFMKRGYVVVGVPDRLIESIACNRRLGPVDPDGAFGALPFPLWRPYVKVVAARPDLAERDPGYRDGSWEFRGWRLTRATFDDVQVSVLSAPGDDALGPAVMGSVRQVTRNSLGCPVDSGVLDHPDVDARPLPAAEDVTGVVVCDYTRDRWGEGLEGSRELTGEDAPALVTAIRSAPPVAEFDRKGTCRHRTDRALTLLFRGKDGQVVTSAFVYVDSCAENGIVAPGVGTRQLTRDDCAPLFAEPPIGLFLVSTMGVADACSTRPGDGQYVAPDPFG